MPIYPNGPKASAEVKQALHSGKDGDLEAAFRQALQAHDLWWDNYLVVDQAILAALVEFTGGIDLGDSRSNGQEIVGLLPIADQDIRTAYELQARIAQGICQRFEITLQNASPEEIVELLLGSALTHSMHTDLTPDELLASWSRMRGAGSLACEFPTLSGR